MFENKRIFVFGMSKSGYEVAKFLAKHHNKILITDAKEQDEEHVKELENLGVQVVITDKQINLLNETFDYMIKNPGIKYDNELVVKAHKLGIPVINELEVAYTFIDKDVKIIGVTGSNGKTTTVTLIDKILKEDGKNSILCGNIGTPLVSMLSDIKKDSILVIEISDHQLCDMYQFKTNISVLTNISETHIDFHDSYKRYKEMKKRIFNHHTENDLAVLNFDNKEVVELTNDIKSSKKFFSVVTRQKCYIEFNKIFYGDEVIIDLGDICVKGMHNYENIMAAIIACKEFNVKTSSIVNVLEDFKGVEHRIEFVKELNDIKFYNDSKSTNNQATITALKSFDEDIVLIMGGLDRNIPFDDIAPYLKNVKKINAYGETADKIKKFAEKNNVFCATFSNLRQATENAYYAAEPGNIVLLSPACASWDQYDNFESRGKEFKKIIDEL